MNFKKNSKPKSLKKKKNEDTLETWYVLFEIREMVLSAIFLLPQIEATGLKILTAKQMLQRLSIAIALVKAGNIFENLWNGICKIIYFLY